MALHALIFDLDGVIADTASYHFESWRQIAAEEGLAFDWQLNERLRSLSRRASLEIILAENGRTLDELGIPDERLDAMLASLRVS